MAANATPQPVGRAARRRARRVDFLFDPSAVAQTLGGLPQLAAALGDPHREGEPASTLPGARKSARELYRVLGNTHYEHLAQLLATLDGCVGAGFTQPTLMRTRGRRPFVEAIAELHTAEHFRGRAFTITGFDAAKAGASVPDVLIEGNGVTAVVEVYCPRAWPGLADYTDALLDRVKNLDRGIDFEFRIEYGQLRQFDHGMRLLQLYPEELAAGLDEQTRLTAVGALISGLETALDTGAPPYARFEIPVINLGTTVELDAVGSASEPIPARAGVVSGPSFGGYRPELMFEDIIERVVEKLEQGQAVGVVPGAVPVLVVELSQSEVTSELRNEWYRTRFEEFINDGISDLHGYGVVAFCEAVEWGTKLLTHFFVVESDVTDNATARVLFP